MLPAGRGKRMVPVWCQCDVPKSNEREVPNTSGKPHVSCDWNREPLRKSLPSDYEVHALFSMAGDFGDKYAVLPCRTNRTSTAEGPILGMGHKRYVFRPNECRSKSRELMMWDNCERLRRKVSDNSNVLCKETRTEPNVLCFSRNGTP